MLAAYPIAALWSRLPYSKIRHVYSVAAGLSLLIFCLGPIAWIHSFITSSVTYVIVRSFPPRLANKLVFIFAFAYLSASHIYRAWVDYMGWTLDFTGSQMVITLKLISFSFNVRDSVDEVIKPVVEGSAKERERQERRFKAIAVC